jgi:hypothetical protein
MICSSLGGGQAHDAFPPTCNTRPPRGCRRRKLSDELPAPPARHAADRERLTDIGRFLVVILESDRVGGGHPPPRTHQHPSPATASRLGRVGSTASMSHETRQIACRLRHGQGRLRLARCAPVALTEFEREVARRLGAVRRRSGWTQEQLADRIGVETALSRYETARIPFFVGAWTGGRCLRRFAQGLLGDGSRAPLEGLGR